MEIQSKKSVEFHAKKTIYKNNNIPNKAFADITNHYSI